MTTLRARGARALRATLVFFKHEKVMLGASIAAAFVVMLLGTVGLPPPPKVAAHGPGESRRTPAGLTSPAVKAATTDASGASARSTAPTLTSTPRASAPSIASQAVPAPPPASRWAHFFVAMAVSAAGLIAAVMLVHLLFD